MQYPTAQLAIANLNGATFIGIDTLTAVKLKGGKKNPMQGRVTKVMRNASTMCFSNNKTNGYGQHLFYIHSKPGGKTHLINVR